jgi:two-component system, LytTR family, sensor kinase
MNNRYKLYWIAQFTGWTLWLFRDLYGSLLQVDEPVYLILTFIANVFFCVFLTDQYRRIVKRKNWMSLKYEQIMLHIVVASAVMSVILTIVNFVVDAIFLNDYTSSYFILAYLMTWAQPAAIWLIFYHIFHYFEKTRDIEIEKVRLEASIKETESKVLRAQLNPHFMFNALNSIRALILEDPDKAQKGITQLSNILRSSLLADRRKTVSLSEELRTVDDYLALEKIRYEERLEVRKNIYPDALKIQVPPMMLQTLVENAIKHGVSKPVKGGFVGIEAQVKNNFLDLRISNTGILENTEQTEASGFGIENTAHRLTLLFGEQASFKIYQASKDVVCAEVLIPIG